MISSIQIPQKNTRLEPSNSSNSSNSSNPTSHPHLLHFLWHIQRWHGEDHILITGSLKTSQGLGPTPGTIFQVELGHPYPRGMVVMCRNRLRRFAQILWKIQADLSEATREPQGLQSEKTEGSKKGVLRSIEKHKEVKMNEKQKSRNCCFHTCHSPSINKISISICGSIHQSLYQPKYCTHGSTMWRSAGPWLDVCNLQFGIMVANFRMQSYKICTYESLVLLALDVNPWNSTGHVHLSHQVPP